MMMKRLRLISPAMTVKQSLPPSRKRRPETETRKILPLLRFLTTDDWLGSGEFIYTKVLFRGIADGTLRF
jgi:hypothetical protein